MSDPADMPESAGGGDGGGDAGGGDATTSTDYSTAEERPAGDYAVHPEDKGTLSDPYYGAWTPGPSPALSPRPHSRVSVFHNFMPSFARQRPYIAPPVAPARALR